MEQSCEAELRTGLYMRTLGSRRLLWAASISLGISLAFGNTAGGDEQSWVVEAVLPEHEAPPESYLCMRVDLPSTNALKLVGVEPLSKEELVHHMLLYGTRTCLPLQDGLVRQ